MESEDKKINGLEMAQKRTHKIVITDMAIEKVPLIKQTIRRLYSVSFLIVMKQILCTKIVRRY